MKRNENPKISIIIPHYNNFQILNACINSILNIKYKDYEIIIIDDCSTDDSIDQIKQKYNNLIVLQSTNKLGYAGACNEGVKISKGSLILFLNNDTEHDFNFIEPLVNKLESNEKIACVQPKIKNFNNKNFFDYAGASGGYIDYLVFPFARGRIFQTIEKDQNQYDDSRKIFWSSGAGFITKKNIFNQLGGFDKKLFSHMEEIDYCWRCYLAGYECWVEPKSMIYHHGAKTLSYNTFKKTYLNHRNSMILLLTNYSLSLSLYLFPFRLFLEIISSMYDLFRLKFSHFAAHYLAIFYILFNIKFLYEKRKQVNRIRIISDKKIFDQKIILNKSIVSNYFFYKKKTFDQNF